MAFVFRKLERSGFTGGLPTFSWPLTRAMESQLITVADLPR